MPRQTDCFRGPGAVQSAGVVGDELGQSLFRHAFGFQVFAEGLGEAVISLEVLGGGTTVCPVRPWRRALREALRLPVLGPTDLSALSRLISVREGF